MTTNESMATIGRDEAERLLTVMQDASAAANRGDIVMNEPEASAFVTAMGSVATAHALLAIEERLGELVEAQREASVMVAMVQLAKMSGHGSGEEIAAEGWLRAHLRGHRDRQNEADAQ